MNNIIYVKNKILNRIEEDSILILIEDKEDTAYLSKSLEYLILKIQDWFWDELEIAEKLKPIATTYGDCLICEFNSNYYYIDRHQSLVDNFAEYEPLNKKQIDEIIAILIHL